MDWISAMTEVLIGLFSYLTLLLNSLAQLTRELRASQHPHFFQPSSVETRRAINIVLLGRLSRATQLRLEPA